MKYLLGELVRVGGEFFHTKPEHVTSPGWVMLYENDSWECLDAMTLFKNISLQFLIPRKTYAHSQIAHKIWGDTLGPLSVSLGMPLIPFSGGSLIFEKNLHLNHDTKGGFWRGGESTSNLSSISLHYSDGEKKKLLFLPLLPEGQTYYKIFCTASAPKCQRNIFLVHG